MSAEPNTGNVPDMQKIPRKRNKKRYMPGQPNKRFRRSRDLEVGMQGILITCGNNNQRPCTAEALDLLNEYADKLYGPEFQDQFETSEQKDAEDEDEDVDVALKKEVEQLRAYRTNQERRFQVLDSGAYNVIFIRTQNIEPDKLVHYLMSDLHATKKKKSRLILRMLPVMGTCRPYQEDILKYLTVFLAPWFKAPNRATFKVAYKARNNNQHRREEIIKNIAGVLGKLNHKNRANLMDPEFAVVVEIIKNVCCVSVVKDYKLYRKYNVYEIVKDGPATDEATTKTDESAAEVKEKPSGGEGDNTEGKMEEEEGKDESRGEEGGEGKDEEVNKEEVNEDEGEEVNGDEDEGEKVNEVEGEGEEVNDDEDEKVNEDEGEKVNEDEGKGEANMGENKAEEVNKEEGEGDGE
ncbi:THUMP domain-containing protein 1 [Kryptolebias marmoratus]|uniref:THUMP domain-containing protein 1 n=1 Tax=Kryptolebias marmoratus TaxID=37003 RepID=A0A3Q3A9U5_KRYMA|nr:THUMP domain-containing protein 1 [Kryptolebias marmoratus]